MDASRKANREDNEKTLQYQSRQEALLVEEMNEGKLTQLLAMINQLEQSPAEAAELHAESKLSASANGSKAKQRAHSTLACATGWAGTCSARNRLCMHEADRRIGSGARLVICRSSSAAISQRAAADHGSPADDCSMCSGQAILPKPSNISRKGKALAEILWFELRSDFTPSKSSNSTVISSVPSLPA